MMFDYRFAWRRPADCRRPYACCCSDEDHGYTNCPRVNGWNYLSITVNRFLTRRQTFIRVRRASPRHSDVRHKAQNHSFCDHGGELYSRKFEIIISQPHHRWFAKSKRDIENLLDITPTFFHPIHFERSHFQCTSNPRFVRLFHSFRKTENRTTSPTVLPVSLGSSSCVESQIVT